MMLNSATDSLAEKKKSDVLARLLLRECIHARIGADLL